MEIERPKNDVFGHSHLLFLSHAGSDTEAARVLAERIGNTPEAREAGLKVWFDRNNLERVIAGKHSLNKPLSETPLPLLSMWEIMPYG